MSDSQNVPQVYYIYVCSCLGKKWISGINAHPKWVFFSLYISFRPWMIHQRHFNRLKILVLFWQTLVAWWRQHVYFPFLPFNKVLTEVFTPPLFFPSCKFPRCAACIPHNPQTNSHTLSFCEPLYLPRFSSQPTSFFTSNSWGWGWKEFISMRMNPLRFDHGPTRGTIEVRQASPTWLIPGGVNRFLNCWTSWGGQWPLIAKRGMCLPLTHTPYWVTFFLLS